MRKLNIVLTALAAACFLSGCAQTSPSADPSAATASTAVTDAERADAAYDACIDALKDEDADPESVFIKNFPYLTAEERTALVDTWIYGVYNAAGQFVITDTQRSEYMRALKPDRTFDQALMDEKAWDEMQARAKDHIVLRFVNGELFYDVDYGYFHEKFGNALLPDYDMLLEFFHEEKTVDYCDEGRVELYPDVIVDRLNRLEQALADYPESKVRDLIEESRDFYRCEIFGAYAQDYVFEDGKIRDNVLNCYRTCADSMKDPETGAFMKELADSYEVSHGVRTVPIYERIKQFCKVQEETKPES